MPLPSSTSSSDTPPASGPRSSLDPRGLRPWGVAWAALFLLVFEIGVARSDAFWAFPERSSSGAFAVLERRVFTARPDPVVVALGSSRLRDAVVPSALEDPLGLPRGAVVNAGLTAGTPVDAWSLYERNRDWFRKASVLLVAIDDWTFIASMSMNDRERRMAPFSALVESRQGTLGVVRAVVDRVSSTLLGRKRIQMVVQQPWLLAEPLPLDDDDRLAWRIAADREYLEDVDVSADVARYYRDPAPSRFRAEALTRLVAAARDDGLRVVFLQVPWRDDYVSAVAARQSDAWRAFVRRRDALPTEFAGTPLVTVDRGRDVGVPDTLYRDYGHMTPEGGRRYTAYLARELQRLRVLDDR